MVFEDIKNTPKNELIGLALQQSEQINRLSQMLKRTEHQRDALAEDCGKLQEIIEKREIRLENCGSIAEAALEIQGLMQSAQTAADIYIENIRRMSAETAEKCAKLENESLEKAEQTVSAASEKAVEIIAAAEARAEEIMRSASESANEIIKQAELTLQAAKKDSEELRHATVQFFIDRENESRG